MCESPSYTRHVLADNGLFTFDLLVEPDADLDTWFRAWDNDEMEFLNVNGAHFEIADVNYSH